MYKSHCVLFCVIHFVNCMYADNEYASPIDDGNIRVIALPDVSNNFLTAASWNEQTQNSHAVDFVSPPGVNSIYRYDYNAQRIYGATILGEINPSFMSPVKDCNNEYVVGLDGVIKLIRWDGLSPTATVIRNICTVYGHTNNFITDRAGRLYFGTLNSSILCAADADFALYRYSKGRLTKIVQGLTSSTAFAIDYNRNKFYHVDACRYNSIMEFDYDPKTGDICNGRVVFDFKNAGATPLPLVLGMTVDTIGRLYCTLYGIGQMWVIDSKTSRLLHKVNFPSPGVTEVGFWGPNLDELYVLAARTILFAYGGGIRENRTQDRVFFKVERLNARGYSDGRVRLDDHYNCH